MHEKETSPALETMQRFVDNGAGELYSEQTQDRLYELRANTLRCVDDRDNGSAEIIAIPGAGLGVMIDVFGGLKLLEADVNLQEVANIFTNELGLPSYHTDEAKQSDSLCCAGCGHCSGALAKPEKYLLTGEAVEFLNGYLPELGTDVEPTVYTGGHSAQAVIVVEGTDAGLTASFEGTNVFVYQPDWHTLYLNKVADALSEELGIDAAELSSAFKRASESNLAVTLGELAEGLPVYTLRAVDGELVLNEA